MLNQICEYVKVDGRIQIQIEERSDKSLLGMPYPLLFLPLSHLCFCLCGSKFDGKGNPTSLVITISWKDLYFCFNNDL